MKAAVFYGPGGSWPEKPMSIEERPVPAIGPKEVLVRVAACGVCRTDLEYLTGKGATPKPPPIILGHEPSGIVDAVGAEVRSLKAGARVLIVASVPCMTCDNCRNGHENLCSNMVVIGADCDGAFAEYVVAPEQAVYILPDDLPLEDSAVITDAVAASYHAVYDVANVQQGDTVVIYGASGGLGLVCVQLAYALGARVIGVGRKIWKLDKAREMGASVVLSTDEVDRVSKEVRRITGTGADISIDVTGVPGMMEEAVKGTRPGGKVVELGFSFHKFELPINRLMWNELKVMGSKNYNGKDMPAILSLVQKGVVSLEKLVSHRFRLNDINEAYQMLDRGEVLRAIVVPSRSSIEH
jgi:2-desacetyl-2-hydroxyethyl bacteriochlorophyllide A dehydrogenase